MSSGGERTQVKHAALSAGGREEGGGGDLFVTQNTDDRKGRTSIIKSLGTLAICFTYLYSTKTVSIISWYWSPMQIIR